jgi:protocatechuate 3,4-dioxygenase alpha subunit
VIGRTADVATASQTIGPFFDFAVVDEQLGLMTERFATGEPVRLLVRVTDGNGEPVSDALVELVQDGVFGRMATGPEGTCEFRTMRPGTSARTGVAGNVAPHIDVCLFARGLLRQLHTRIYFAGDAALTVDPTLTLVPAERRSTLLAVPDPSHDGTWVYQLRLQGASETVFFDV